MDKPFNSVHKDALPMPNTLYDRDNNSSKTTQLGVQHSVVRLYSWPELPKLPSEMVVDVARVCALLAIRPTGTPLIHRLLGLTRERVVHIVDMLELNGHLVSNDPVFTAKASLSTGDTKDSLVAAESAVEISSYGGSVLARLWKRLSGKLD